MATNTLYLVCDMINDLVHADGPSKKSYGPELARRKTVENTATAIAKARAAGAKIGYVRVGFSKAGMFKLGTWGTEVHPLLAPQAGDFDIVKHRVSPFYATSLDVILRANGIQRLYVSGVSSSGAVLSAAKDGHDRGYDVFVLDDCCCALSEEQHQAVIEQVKRMTTVTTSAQVTFHEEFQL